MPNATAKVSVETELKRVIEDLERIQQASKNTGNELQKAGQKVGDSMVTQTKRTERFMSDLGSFSSRVASRIKDDFKALTSLQAVTQALSLSNQFKGAVTQGVNLSDQIRRLSGVFGIAKKDFSSFQSAMTRGLGEIGLSSESAANALQGLAETPVRGQEALIEYAKTAGQLASLSGERGREGDIAKSISQIITAQGGNPNDLAQMHSVSDQILRIRNATGKGATEVASTLRDLFKGVNQQFKPMLARGGAVTLAAAALQAGPEATSFLKEFLKKTPEERAGMESQGLGRIINADGTLNAAAIQKTIDEAKRRSPFGNVEAGLKTMGMSDEAAKGFILLSEAMKTNGDTINNAHRAMVNLNEEFLRSRSLIESFTANIHKVLGLFGGVTNKVADPLRDFMNKMAGSTAGATAVVAGGGILAAILARAGLKGVGGALGEGIGGLVSGALGGAVAKEAGAIPVWVVNANQIGGGGIPGGLGASVLGATGLGAVASIVAVAVGTAMAIYANEKTQEEKIMRPFERAKKREEEQKEIAASAGKMFGNYKIEGIPQDVRFKVEVESKSPDITLKTKRRGRGMSQ